FLRGEVHPGPGAERDVVVRSGRLQARATGEGKRQAASARRRQALMPIESVRIPARHDGFALGGELHLPATGAPRACVLIAGAMAVRMRFYSPFAQFLAGQGIAAL